MDLAVRQPGHSICFVSDEIYPATRGGIGRLLVEAADRLHEAGWTITFLLAVDAPAARRFRDYARTHFPHAVVHRVEDLLTELDPDDDIPLWAFHFLPYHQSHRIALALRRLSSRQSFDVIEFADHRGLGYVTLKWRRLWASPFSMTRIVVRLHGTFELWIKADGAQNHSRQELHTFQMERYCLKHADGWLSPSKAVAAWYRAHYSIPDKPIGVSTPAFQRLGPGHTHPRRVQQPLNVLFYGKLQHLKGADVFVKAALEVCAQELPPVRFHLVGHDVRDLFGPSYRARLESLIPRQLRDRFIFHGRIKPEDLPALANRCTLAVVPSRVETFCLAAHELNWIGIPLVLRALPAFEDFFQDGVNCRLFVADEETAPEALARTLIEVLRAESPFDRWVWNAPTIVEAERTVAAYRQVLAWPLPEPVDQPVPASTVSVIIPYFNAQATVEDTLASVLQSSISPTEIIVVDDGSTQPAAVAYFDALRDRHARDPRFRFLRKSNGGLSSARNAALAVATGTYVLPLDADDLIEPDYLALALEALDRNPGLAATSCFVGYFADGGQVEEVIDYVIAYDLDPLLITLENRAGVAGSVFRRTALPQPAYSEILPAYEDWDLWWTLAEAGAGAEVLPRVLYRYRRRPEGLYAQVGQARHAELVAAIESRHPALLTRLGPERPLAMARMRVEGGRYHRLRRRLRDVYHRFRS